MADGNVVDAASVKISPDTSGFRRELRAELARINESVTVHVNADVDTSKASATLEAWRRRQSGHTVEQKIKVDTDTLDKAVSVVSSVTRGLAGISLASAGALSAMNAVAGLASAASAAVGVVGLLPGALAAAGVAAGTLMLGADGIKEAFEGARGPAQALRTAVEDTFANSLTPAVEHVSALLPQLTGGFQNVARALSEAANDTAAMLAEAANVERLQSVLDGTANITRNLGAAMAPIGEALLHIASIGVDVFQGMTTGAASAAESFRDWATSAEGTQKIRDWITGGVEALKQIGAVIGDVLASIRAVGQAFADAGVGLGGTFGAATASIREFLESAQGQEALRTLATTMQSLATTVSDVLATAFQTLGPAIQAALPGIAQLASQLGTQLQAALQVVGPMLTQLFTFLSNNMSWIGPLAIAIGTVVTAFKAWTVATNVLKVALNALGKATWIGLIITAVVWLVTVIIQNWDKIKEFLQQTWENIKAIASQVWTAISDFFVNLWEGIKNTALSIWNGIANFFTTTTNNIKNFFVNAWNGMVSFLANAWNRISAAVSNGINSVLNWVRGLPKRILSALGDLGNLLWNAGRSIINGLLNGLKSAVGAVWDFVGGIAGKIADLKGPLPYDRRLLIPAGTAIMEGLYEGLRDNFAPVENLVSRMAPRLAGHFSGNELRNVQWDGLENGLSSTLKSMTSQVQSTVRDMGRAIERTTFRPSLAFSGSPDVGSGTATVTFAGSGVDTLTLPRGSSVSSPAARSSTGLSASDNYAALAQAVAEALDGVRVEMDPNGLLRVVDKARMRKVRRG